MRITAQGSCCTPPRLQNQSATSGVGARNGRISEQASRLLARASNHRTPVLARTVVTLFSDEGAFIGFRLFGQRSDARAFLRAGGA